MANNSDLVLSDVKVSVIKNGKIDASYGVSISDTIHWKKREEIIQENGGDRKGWSHLIDSENHLTRNIPITTDSSGHFWIGLHEGSIFDQTEYQIQFEKDGYKDFIIEGNWETKTDLKIRLKSTR